MSKNKLSKLPTLEEATDEVTELITELARREVQFNLRHRWDVKTFTFTASNDANAVKYYFPEFKVLPNQARDGFYAALDIQYI